MWLSVRRAYHRWKSSPPVVVVSGLPRSGTSMAMKMLEAGGLALSVDHVRRADYDNPKGYFELERVKDLEQEGDKSWLRDSRGKSVKVISQLLQELPSENFYQVIFMNRHLDEVLASQNKMLERRGEPLAEEDEPLREMFDRHLFIIKRWLARQPNFVVLYLDYARVVAEPEEAARAIRDFLERDLNVQRMAEVVDPDLYRNRA